MKKSDANSYIVYFLLIVVAVLMGAFVLRPTMSVGYPSVCLDSKIVAIVAAVGTILIIPICFEVMHLLGAKAGGYQVYSFNVFGFNFYKDGEGNTKFRMKGFNGLSGETKIAPKERKNGKECNPKAMLWFGNLFLSILLLAAVMIYLSFGANTNEFKVATITFIILDVVYLIYNISPVELDTKSDGYQLKLVGKESDLPVYNEYLRIERAAFYGEKIGNVKVFLDNMSDFAARIDMITIYKYIEENKIYEAIKLIDSILAKKEDLHYNVGLQFIAQKLFLQLYSGRFEDAKKYYSEIASDEKRDISNSKDFVCLRTYILISSFLDPSESEVQYATSLADKSFKKVDKSFQEIEKTLYKGALKVTQEAHPKWVLIVED